MLRKYLYYGTSESLAKITPYKGIQSNTLISGLLAPYQAFDTSNIHEKWGIVEFLISKRPKNLERYITLKSPIPPELIYKVWIYDPKSNWFITRAILHLRKEKNKKKLSALTRWLTGEFVMLDEWLDTKEKKQFTSEQKSYLNDAWHNRIGLNLFYQKSI